MTTGPFVEAAARAIVLASTAAAVGTYGWLIAPFVPTAVVPTAAVVFATTFAWARVSARFALLPALVFAYTHPALLAHAFGRVEYHLILIWLASLAGPILALSPWHTWHLPPVIRLLAGAWALALAVTWPLIAGREVDFSTMAARTADTANGLRAGPPWHAASWVVSAALGQLLALLALDLLWARFGRDRLRDAGAQIAAPLAAGAACGALVGAYQWLVDLNWLNAGDWPSLGRAAGLMLDANSFGIASAIWVALTAVAIWHSGRGLFSAALMALLAFGMWTSGSRTALLTLVAGLIGVVVGAARRLGTWQARLIPVAALAGFAVAVVAITFTVDLGGRSSPLQRLVATLPTEGTSLAETAADLWDRDGYGAAAAAAITEYPVSGVGVGAFTLLSSDYAFSISGRAIQPDNAQNWWRHQVAELGLAGGAAALILSLVLAILVATSPPRAEWAAVAAVIKALLMGLALASLVGMPTQHPALALTVAVLVYALLATAREGWWTHAQVATPPAWAIAWTLVVLTAVLHWQSAHGPLRVIARAVRYGFPYAYGFSAPAPSSEYAALRWTGRHAAAVLNVPARYLELHVWAEHPDAATHPVHVEVQAGATRVIDEDVSSDAPLVRVVEVPLGARFFPLELQVSRTFGDGYGLKVGANWHRERPR
jgi:hypothetical protein